MNNKYVLDSFALLAWFQDEKGAAEVETLIKAAEKGEASLLLSVINLGEIYYITHRERDPVSANHALSIIDALPIKIIMADKEIALKAAELKARHSMAYADTFAAAVGIINNGIIVTGDPEFKQLQSLAKIKWL